MRSLFRSVALIACAFAGPASASDGRIVIDGYDYAVPAPKGYCTDGPSNDAFFNRMRQTVMKSRRNGPAMLMPCAGDQTAFDFYMVTVTSQPPMTRTDYLTLMRRTMPVALTPEQAGDPRQMSQRLAEALRDKSPTYTRMHPIGVTNVCALAVSQVPRTITGTIVYTMVRCSSVIQKRVVYLMRIVPSTDFDRIDAALQDLPRMFETIRSDATT